MRKSKIIKKWVAGFWCGKLIVVKWKFYETAKTFTIVREDNNQTYEEAHNALGFKCLFLKDATDQRLFDTWKEALERLHNLETKATKEYRDKIGKCQDRMSLLGRFSEKMQERS